MSPRPSPSSFEKGHFSCSPSAASSSSLSSILYSPSPPCGTVPVLDEGITIPLKAFAECREHIRNAPMMLTWSRQGNIPYIWPRWSDGRLVQPHKLPAAFTRLLITSPQCPCATQETDPKRFHDYVIWVVQNGEYCGKVAAACVQKQYGCNAWICLTDLIANNPDLPSQVYFEHPADQQGPGIPGFDRCGLLRHVDASQAGGKQSAESLSSSFPATPPPPYSLDKKNRRGFGGITKSKGKASTRKKVANNKSSEWKIVGPSHDPFTTPSRPGSPSHSNKSLTFTLPPLPIPSGTSSISSYGSPKEDGPANSQSGLPPSSQFLSEKDEISSQSQLNFDSYSREEETAMAERLYDSVAVLPGDRLFGETACLWEPPDISKLYTYNRHVPALRGPALEQAFHRLGSDTGVSTETFWQVFDQCNCGVFLTKECLHYVHGPKCLAWPYNDIPADYVVYDPKTASSS